MGSGKLQLGGELAKNLPAKFSYALNLLFLGSAESTVEPDGCCPSGCSWLQGYDDTDTCYGRYCESIRRHRELQCPESGGSCNSVRIYYQKCYVEEGNYWHNCPWSNLTSCGSTGTTPTPSPTPTPEPSPTPTPCPAGSFNPDENGNCPSYANKVNGCCVCQQTTDCSSFGQGTWPDGSPYCIWVGDLCDCYNIDGPCRDNPRPSSTPTPSGGGGGGSYRREQQSQYEYYGFYYYDECTVYVWVWYVSYDDGETWEPTGEVDYAGCW